MTFTCLWLCISLLIRVKPGPKFPFFNQVPGLSVSLMSFLNSYYMVNGFH